MWGALILTTPWLEEKARRGALTANEVAGQATRTTVIASAVRTFADKLVQPLNISARLCPPLSYASVCVPSLHAVESSEGSSVV